MCPGRTHACMVGLGGLEPPTSPLSGARSSHLSYRPAHCGNNSSYFTVQPTRWQFRTLFFSPSCSWKKPSFSVHPASILSRLGHLGALGRALRPNLPTLSSSSQNPFRWSGTFPSAAQLAPRRWTQLVFQRLRRDALFRASPATPSGSLHVQSGCRLSHHVAAYRHRPRQFSVRSPRRPLWPQAYVDLLRS